MVSVAGFEVSSSAQKNHTKRHFSLFCQFFYFYFLHEFFQLLTTMRHCEKSFVLLPVWMSRLDFLSRSHYW